MSRGKSLPDFDTLLRISGEIYRAAPGRETLAVTIDGNRYLLKRHTGVGWGEIVKNLLQMRPPVLGAVNEYRGLSHLAALGITAPRVVDFQWRGRNPARRQSYLLSEYLEHTVSLEHYGVAARMPIKSPAEKRTVIRRLAGIARRMHEGGLNHRDFYLCHFHVPGSLTARPPITAASPIHLIDLHRAQIRRRTPLRWRAKDLGGLLFSALDNGLTRGDCLRFVSAYRGKPARQVLAADRRLWRRVVRNADRLYQKSGRARHPLIARLLPR